MSAYVLRMGKRLVQIHKEDFPKTLTRIRTALLRDRSSICFRISGSCGRLLRWIGTFGNCKGTGSEVQGQMRNHQYVCGGSGLPRLYRFRRFD